MIQHPKESRKRLAEYASKTTRCGNRARFACKAFYKSQIFLGVTNHRADSDLCGRPAKTQATATTAGSSG